MKKWVKKCIKYILDLIFVEKCFLCRKEGQIICEDCTHLLKNQNDFLSNNTFALFSYKDPSVKRIMINLKYFGRKGLGKKLGEIMYKNMLEEISDIKSLENKNIIITPIPMNKKRIRIRMYNHASLIARGFYEASKNSGENIFEFREDILVKNKNTVRQAKIKDRSKRLKNLRGSFSCKKESSIRGRTIIIVDDITTTGATINEARRVLKKSGAKKVYGFVVAH